MIFSTRRLRRKSRIQYVERKKGLEGRSFQDEDVKYEMSTVLKVKVKAGTVVVVVVVVGGGWVGGGNKEDYVYPSLVDR